MAYLQPPLTIISSSNSSSSSSSSNNEPNNKSYHHHNPSSSSVELFRLPAATWFDEDQNHFVALEERIGDPYDSFNSRSSDYPRGSFNSGSLVSGLGSLITTNTMDTAKGDDDDDEEEDESGGLNLAEDSELVRYQAFGLPDNKKKFNLDGSDRSSECDLDTSLSSHRINNLSAFESAAKKAAKERSNKSLVNEIAVSFHLPASLANIENREEQHSSSGNTTDDDTTVMLTRRIPILAKFSPMVNGVRYLALQYTPT